MRKLLMLFAVLAATVRGWGATSVTLDWDAVTSNADGLSIMDLSGYRVYYATFSLSGLTTAQAMVSVNVTKVNVSGGVLTALVSGLSDATTYYFRLTAFDTSGNHSGWSAQADGVTDLEVSTRTPAATPVLAPTSLTALAVSSAQVNLSWTRGSTNENGFYIERSPYSNAGFTQVGAVGPGVTGYQDTGLSSNTQYYYRVRAFNGTGNSGYTAVVGVKTSPLGVTGGLTPPPGLKEAYAYPNPAQGVDPVIRAMMGGVDLVEITIFDQSGQAVKSDRMTIPVTVNGEPAYEYRWTGEKASGVYHAVIHGKRGAETIRARTSFAVVK